MRWMVPSGKMLSSSPSAKMHLMVPSGKLKVIIWIQILHYFFCAVWEVLLNLIVCKFKDLKTIWKGGLGRLSLSKIVNDLLVWVGLFDIMIIEVNDGITIWEYFPLHAIIKNYLLFTVLINSLNLTIVTNNLLHNLHVLRILIMVDLRELHVKIFLLLLISIDWRKRVLR